MENTEDFDIEDFFDDVLNNADSIQKPQTFLSTIGKSYYETYLSKILLYVLTQQKRLLARLINNYAQKLINNYAQKKNWENWVDVVEDKLEVVKACTEMSMNGGRADVFLELKYNNDRIITFTVENKCYATEHKTGDDISQTQTYAKYIKSAYAGSKNVFYYLKPEFNSSQAKCDVFITITYSELKEFLDEYNDSDYIINDFKIHIGEFLKMNNFNDKEKMYLQNYKTIKDFINGAEDKRNNLIKNVMDELKDEFKNSCGEVEFEIVDKKTVLKVYHKDWKTDDYHFYSEIKFEGGSLTNVICQNTAYANKKDDILHDYMKQEYMKGNKLYDHCAYEQWYIFKDPKPFSSEEGFLSEEDFLSPEWINELKRWAKGAMKGYYGNMSDIVKAFLEWKKNHNTNKT